MGSEIVPAGTRDRPRSDQRHRGGRCGGRVVPGRPRVAVVTTGSSSRERIDAGPGRDLRVERRDARGAAGCTRSEVGMPRSVADDEERTAARSSKASRSTCWSRLAASPSARTISCSGSSSSGSRRSSGVLRSSRARPCRSAALQGHGVRPADDHVSSLVACLLFVLPAVEALQRATDPGPRLEWGRLAGPVRRDPHRDVFLRALAQVVKRPVSSWRGLGQDSHMIARAAGAECACARAARRRPLPRRLSRRVPAPMRALRRGRRRTRASPRGFPFTGRA